MSDEVKRRRPAPIRLEPQFEQEYPASSTLATECHINVGVTWETVEPVFTRLLDCYGLSISGFNVLEVLRGARKPLPPSIITDHMLVTRGAMTKIIDTLQERDMVRRQAHPRDRRMLLVGITDTGMRLMDELLQQLHRLEPGWFDVLTSEEQETLIQLLGKVQARFQDLSDSFCPEPSALVDAGRGRGGSVSSESWSV